MDLAKTRDSVTLFFRNISRALQEDKYGQYLPQILMGLVIVLLVTSMFPSGQSVEFANLKEGDVYIGREIIAPFTFEINKNDNELTSDRKSAREKIPLVFLNPDSIETSAIQRFEDFFHRIDSLRISLTTDSIKVRKITELLNHSSIILEQQLVPLFLQEEWGLFDQPKPLKFANIIDSFKTILFDLYAIGILNLPSDQIPDFVDRVSVISFDGETLQELETFFNIQNYKDVVLLKLRQAFPQQNDIVKIGYPVITTFLLPNLIYDETQTEIRRDEAVANVPLAKGFVLEAERIVSPHEVITKEALEKLNSLASAKSEHELSRGGIRLLYPFMGKILIVCLSLSFLALFLITSRAEIFNSLKKMMMVFLVFIIILTITFFINKFGLSSNLKYLIPISIASMLLTIFFDTRTAFVGTVTLSIMIGALRGNEFGFTIISLFVGSISTFSVREIQARSWILKATLSISSMYFLGIAAVELLKGTEVRELWNMWLYGILNGIAAPIVTYAIMIFFESLFKVTTNSKLLELSDLNKPLLRELAIRAPGTYHHSIMVGNLSETAAEAIGANALLTRVSSYYHDIGKMEKPEYFVENQKGGKNPHEKLTPTMSCLILINHVKRGLEIADEYGLPPEIRQFIPEHHGTNLIQFFYAKALENSDGQEINEDNFHYHGPKPQTKETGIVMLADAVEAGSRALKEPSVSRIRNMVENFVQERLRDSELDECPLTMRDLNMVKESFINNLTGMFHGRIQYPDSKRNGLKAQKKKSNDGKS